MEKRSSSAPRARLRHPRGRGARQRPRCRHRGGLPADQSHHRRRLIRPAAARNPFFQSASIPPGPWARSADLTLSVRPVGSIMIRGASAGKHEQTIAPRRFDSGDPGRAAGPGRGGPDGAGAGRVRRPGDPLAGVRGQPAFVTAAKGKSYARDLTRDDFAIYENGAVRQEIKYFNNLSQSQGPAPHHRAAHRHQRARWPTSFPRGGHRFRVPQAHRPAGQGHGDGDGVSLRRDSRAGLHRRHRPDAEVAEQAPARRQHLPLRRRVPGLARRSSRTRPGARSSSSCPTARTPPPRRAWTRPSRWPRRTTC